MVLTSCGCSLQPPVGFQKSAQRCEQAGLSFTTPDLGGCIPQIAKRPSPEKCVRELTEGRLQIPPLGLQRVREDARPVACVSIQMTSSTANGPRDPDAKARLHTARPRRRPGQFVTIERPKVTTYGSHAVPTTFEVELILPGQNAVPSFETPQPPPVPAVRAARCLAGLLYRSSCSPPASPPVWSASA
jgi:hypothetical protein